jgi:hypothetical protein
MATRGMVDTTHMGTIGRTIILNHIRTPITPVPRTTGTMGIGFTATIVIITTGMGTKLT